MTYRVRVLPEAEDDLFAIYSYVAERDSPKRALDLITRLEERCYSLEALANRGQIPPELRRIGVLEYRQIHFRPYRIIFRVLPSEVLIYAILDGRRDLYETLRRRLLG